MRTETPWVVGVARSSWRCSPTPRRRDPHHGRTAAPGDRGGALHPRRRQPDRGHVSVGHTYGTEDAEVLVHRADGRPLRRQGEGATGSRRPEGRPPQARFSAARRYIRSWRRGSSPGRGDAQRGRGRIAGTIIPRPTAAAAPATSPATTRFPSPLSETTSGRPPGGSPPPGSRRRWPPPPPAEGLVPWAGQSTGRNAPSPSTGPFSPARQDRHGGVLEECRDPAAYSGSYRPQMRRRSERPWRCHASSGPSRRESPARAGEWRCGCLPGDRRGRDPDGTQSMVESCATRPPGLGDRGDERRVGAAWRR